MRKYILNQLKQSSTWRGLFMLLGATGIISSDHIHEFEPCASIIAATLAGSGFIGTFFPDQMISKEE